ncbi:D-2-hydroxyacid dehydrogenase family protein [Streptomyces sp. P9(2023)]|uniref:D-2-hydroxyacid dehydrogenase family protein n=1 Tax=Streptomyces sp. P9(2023) TaxID=3064394 RepID=UPI0028F3F2B8|nr:D-2-hydroxyacid dehydrogenase family protein [Streptomyces sp. P9(2023)]MDT9691044.1 D-2-hydroxyacid dehydrogenase family protein [Streptomyces sp. P9(2023)]
MKPRCAVLDDYQGVALASADWSPLADRVDVRVLREHLTDRDALVAAVEDCEILVVMRERTPLDAELLRRLPRLRLVVTSGMRNASIDVAGATALGITVCGTASASEPPAELTWALLLGLARHVPAEARAVREGGPWQSTVGTDLAGRTLGLVGLGKIGGRVARVGLAFGMDVVAWSPNLTDERAAEHGVARAADLQELMERADFVSLHMVLSERTRHLIGEAELRTMRPSAYLVNTSRAGLVDGAALLRALREGWIAGAGLDVFTTEPLPADDPQRTLPNVLALPHLGYVTRGNYGRYFGQAVENIEAFLAGAPVRTLG